VPRKPARNKAPAAMWQVWCDKDTAAQLRRLSKQGRPRGSTVAHYVLGLLLQDRDRRLQQTAAEGPKQRYSQEFLDGFGAGHLAGQLAIAFAQDREAALPWDEIAGWALEHKQASTAVVEAMLNSPYASRFMAYWRALAEPKAETGDGQDAPPSEESAREKGDSESPIADAQSAE